MFITEQTRLQVHSAYSIDTTSWAYAPVLTRSRSLLAMEKQKQFNKEKQDNHMQEIENDKDRGRSRF